MGTRVSTWMHRLSTVSAADAPPASGPLLQRKCAQCGGASSAQRCDECEQRVQRAGGGPQAPAVAPPIVHEVLGASGAPLDHATRAFFEPRFNRDLSQVRVHAGPRAAQSAHAVDALAYTVGRDVVFGAGQFQPSTTNGRQLLAHELTHVAQQNGAASPPQPGALPIDRYDSDAEQQARATSRSLGAHDAHAAGAHGARAPVLSRADPIAAQVTMNLGTRLRTGLQYFPTNVADSRVGPVTVQGGLQQTGISRLQVIVGENLSPRTLARQLLPLWTTATPFTPPGAAAPLPLTVINELELARALLVYNETYLPVPAMTNWRAGLRFPLPVEIDAGTGMATVNPDTIRALSGAFQAAWNPLIDRRAPRPGAVPAATLNADVTAFLTREPTALARGVHLMARALTNAQTELPFIREAFRQAGAAGFDIALAFMDNTVQGEIDVLAAQRDGAAILGQIRNALALAAAPTPAQVTSRTRANRMLAQSAAIVARAPQVAARAQPERTVTVDTVRLDGSNHNPAVDVDLANAIFSQCNVRFAHGVNATATNAQTTGWLGGNTDLRGPSTCGSPTAEERRLFRGATTAFGLSARMRVFFPATISGIGGAAGYAMPPFCATGTAALLRNASFLSNTADSADLAHELGHILLNSGAHPADNLMNPVGPPQGEQLTVGQCNTIRSNS